MIPHPRDAVEAARCVPAGSAVDVHLPHPNHYRASMSLSAFGIGKVIRQRLEDWAFAVAGHVSDSGRISLQARNALESGTSHRAIGSARKIMKASETRLPSQPRPHRADRGAPGAAGIGRYAVPRPREDHHHPVRLRAGRADHSAIGRMVPRKGVENAVRSFGRRVTQHQLPARFLVCRGDNPDLAAMPEIAQVEGVADRVTFVRWKGQEYATSVVANRLRVAINGCPTPRKSHETDANPARYCPATRIPPGI